MYHTGMNETEKRVALWVWGAAIFIGFFVIHPLCYGPWLWVEQRFEVSDIGVFFQCRNFLTNGPDWLVEPYVWYLSYWDADYARVIEIERQLAN